MVESDPAKITLPMAQHDVSTVSDGAKPQAQHEELAAHVHQEAGFSQIGDKSGNQAWSSMTGAGKGAGEHGLGQGAHGAPGDGQGGSINFGAHGDIYAPPNSRSGEGLSSAGAGSSGYEGLSSAGGSPPGGAHAPMRDGGPVNDKGGAGSPGYEGMSSAGGSPPGGAHTAGRESGFNSSEGAAGSGAGYANFGHAGGDSIKANGGGSDGAHGANGSTDLAPVTNALQSDGSGHGASATYAGAGYGKDGQLGADSHAHASSIYDSGAAGGGTRADAIYNQDGQLDRKGQHPLDRQGNSGTTTDKVAAGRAGEGVPFDGQTATYGGKQFYELSQTDKAQLPNETINKVNSNNYTNLQNRVEALGEKMPDVVMRGVGDAGAHDMEVLAGNKTGEYSAARGGANYFAASTQQPTDAKDTIDHLGSHFSRAQGYGNQGAGPEGGRIYAFAHNDLASEYTRPSWTERVAKPLSETGASGESHMKFDKSKMTHIATLSGNDVAEINHPSIIRQDTARSYQNLQSLHKIISAIEENQNN